MRRFLTATLIVLSVSALYLLPACGARAASMEAKSGKGAHKPTGPANGVKTPGIQIPFANLKPAAEIPAPEKPAWIYFAESIYVPGKNSVNKIDTKTNSMSALVSGIANPCAGMTSAFGSLWVPACGDGTLARIDPKSSKITATMAIGADSVPGAIVATGDSIWMLTDARTTLARIDPEQNAVVADLRVPAGCMGLAYAEEALWIACPKENQVYKINPATNLVEKRIDVSAEPDAITAGEKSIWVYCRKEGKIDRIDPKTDKVSKSIELKVPGVGAIIAFGEGSLWASMDGFPITRIDPGSDAVVQQFYGEGGGAIHTSPGAVWVSDRSRGMVERIDPKLISLTLAE